MLDSVFKQFQTGDKPLQWCLKGVPNADFYKALHPFLKKWPITRSATKVAIGKFYIEIDRNFAEKRGRADNVYRYVERCLKSNQPPDQLMIYGRENHLSEIKTLQSSTKHCTEQVQNLSMEVTELMATAPSFFCCFVVPSEFSCNLFSLITSSLRTVAF